MKKKFLAIAGNIGVGKSTLTGLLSARFGWKPYYEVVDTNPYLKDFYEGMKNWAFHLQIFFLSKRFEHHKIMVGEPETVIQDRSIYEDAEVFSRNLYYEGKFDERDYRNYLALFNCMTSYLKSPDLLIYLRATVDTLEHRIRSRGRSCEQNIPRDYLERLNQRYEEWVKNYKMGPVLIVDTENLNVVSRQNDLDQVADLVYQTLLKQDERKDSDERNLAEIIYFPPPTSDRLRSE
ncbi:MAG: deoxynucleoside kinase [Deltaproteobacteria bacterium]|nr:deoxynucleoside kinase [Deltaproteobacteria bacterium]